MIRRIELEPINRRPSGLWMIDLDALPLPDGFIIAEQNLIYLPPRAVGGNHRHPRTEIFIALGSGLVLVWDEAGEVQEQPMMPDADRPVMFIVEPNTPHAVVNRNKKVPASLYELADGPQRNVKPVTLINPRLA